MNGYLFLLFVLLLCFQVIRPEENITPFPTIVTPLNYSLTIIPVLETSPRLCGHVWIDVVALMATTLMIFHASGLVIHRAVVIENVAHPQPAPDATEMVEEMCFSSTHPEGPVDGDIVVDFHQDNSKEMLTLMLSQRLTQGGRYRVGILYTGTVFMNEAKGFFRMQYSGTEETDCCQRSIGGTQLEAIHARKMFPCLDEPAYKSTFQVTVGHENKMKALSNMPMKSSKPMALEQWMWDEFIPTPPMSTYLVAIIVSQLSALESSYRSIDGRNVTIRLWTQWHQFNQLTFALDFVPKVLLKMEEYFRVPYALPKIDVVAVPGFEDSRAMENWGLVVHSEANLLWNEEIGSTIEKSLVAVTIIHELAHQWLGNLVTSTWWDDIWLNEGLTTLFESTFASQTVPELETEFVMVLFLEEAMKTDLLGSSHALNAPVEKLKTIEDKFDAITYSKGAAIFRMARSFVGDEAFQSAVVRFLQQHQFKTANSSDFWALLNQEARRTHSISCRTSVARIMKTWTQQPGYPLVHVHRSKDGIVHLSQRPFKDPNLAIDNATMAITASWWIPVSMTTADEPKFESSNMAPVLWLSPRRPSAEIAGPQNNDSWVLVNLESSGYYRVNYDRRNWELLSQQLLRNHSVIPIVTRAQLIDDAFHLAHAKILSYDVPAMMTQYLAFTRDDSIIRRIANRHVDYMVNLNPEEFDESDQDIIRMMATVNQDRKRRLNGRSRLLSTDEALVGGYCDADDQFCVSEAVKVYRAMVDDTIQPEQAKLMREHFEEVWCAAVRHGGRTEWNFAWESSRRSSSTIEKRKMLKAMTCTIESGQIKQLLSRVFNPNIDQKPSETFFILSNLADNRKARTQLLNFILHNWDFLNSHFRKPSEATEILVNVIKKVNSPEDLEKVKAFLEERTGQEDFTATSEFLHSTSSTSAVKSADGQTTTTSSTRSTSASAMHNWRKYA